MSGKKQGPPPGGIPVDPMTAQMLAAITPLNLPYFMLSNPEFVEEKDFGNFKKAAKNLVKYALGASLVGITLNVQAKRVSEKIVKLPAYVRLPLRLGLFALPFAFVTQLVNK